MKKNGSFEFKHVNVKMLQEVISKHPCEKSTWIENGVNVGEILKSILPRLVEFSGVSEKSILSSVIVIYSSDNGKVAINSVVVND